MANDFITADVLATFIGLTAGINIVVQFTKNPIKARWGDGAVRVYSFVIALVLAFIFTDFGSGVQGVALTFLNAILLAAASTGSFEMIKDPKADKRK